MVDIPDVAMVTGVAQSFIFWAFVLLLVLGLSVGPRYLRSRERGKLYDLMRAAVDKGQPLPPELVASLTAEAETPTAPASGSDRDLRRAIVLIAVGLGLAILGGGLGWGISLASPIGGAITGGVVGGVGAIPGFIGVAYLILWLMTRRSRPQA